MNSREKGNIAENQAIEFLETQNFKIIDRNFYSCFGEIDIIAKKDNILHFVEVKSGKNFQSIYNVTPAKLKKIIKTLTFYMKKNQLNSPYQIDVITIDNGELNFIKNVSFF